MSYSRWYDQGTVSVTSGSAVVTGTTTGWTNQVLPGDAFHKEGTKLYEVLTVDSATQITLATAWGESTDASMAYRIIRLSKEWEDAAVLSLKVSEYLDTVPQILNGSGAPSDTVGSNGAIYFDTLNLKIHAKDAGTWDAGVSFGESYGFTLAVPAAGITVSGTQPVPSNGTITLALADDLAGVEGLSTTGLAARTASNTWTTRTLTSGTTSLTITDGDGVAGNPTIGLDADLGAIAGLGTTGLAARTATNTWAARTLTAPAAGITVTDGGGVAGNPTLALANDLAAVEALATTGLAARTASDTWAARTLTGTTNEITITNGNGVSGNPTVALASTVDLTGHTVTLRDNNTTIKDGVDATKAFQFDASGITTATTRTLTVPDANGTIALAASTQPLDAALTSLSTLGGSLVSGDLLYATAADTLTRLAAGSSGQALKISAGVPGWVTDVTISSVVLRVFTTAGTYTPTSDMVYALAIATGGGGGGGGCSLTAAVIAALAAGGGGAGSTAWAVLTAAQISTSKYVSVGAAGSGGSGNAAGSAGGISGIGTGIGNYSLLQADGGGGGTQATRSTAGAAVGAGAAGVTATTGTLKFYGGAGGYGSAVYQTAVGNAAATSGAGGGSMWGSGGPAMGRVGSGVIAGSAGQAPGSGGSGAAISSATSGATAAGGAGAVGMVVILEFVV